MRIWTDHPYILEICFAEAETQNDSVLLLDWKCQIQSLVIFQTVLCAAEMESQNSPLLMVYWILLQDRW